MYKQGLFLKTIAKLILPLVLVVTACSEDQKGSAPKQFRNPSPTPVPVTMPEPEATPAAPLPALVITNPGGGMKTSNASSLVIEGQCQAGASISVTGDATASSTCSGGSFSVSVTKSSDGSWSFSLTQSLPPSSPSAPVMVSWIRDTMAPSLPTVSAPANNPIVSADSSLTISGGCENGATVNLTGSASDSQACNSGTFNFSVTKAVDGTYDFSLTQQDAAGNTSAAKTLQWVKSSAVPSTPVIAAPAQSPYHSNLTTLVLSGSCTAGNTVELSGAESGSVNCVSGAFSFNLSQSVDGSYNYSVVQKTPANVSSAAASITWVRDSVAPGALVLTNPAVSPYISGESSITLSGSCESGATVLLSGAATSSVVCSGGTFSVNVSKTTDGSYGINLVQQDLAGNSSPALSFTWVRDTSTPAAPTLVSPSSPYISNTGSVTITGGCESQSTIQISGDASASANCLLNSFSVTVSKTADGIYNFNLVQTDLAGNTSSALVFSWQRDTVAPGAVTLVQPATNPYTSSDSVLNISGSCESGAVVSLSGADSQTQICAANAYAFSSSKSIDGTYEYSLIQTDPAGNSSLPLALSWTRNSVVPSAPTIEIPSVATYTSKLSSLTISGGCQAGNTVELSGAATDSVSCAGGIYSFNVSKTSDGTYDFSVKQKSPSNILSAAASLQWIRDTVAPIAPTVANPASNPKYSNGNTLSISGSCENGATVSLSGAESATIACASGSYSFNLGKIVDGNYAYAISQTDAAGNTSATTAFSWIRDTVVPAKPGLVSPIENPHASGDTNIALTLSCEVGASLNMSGAGTGTATCSALGQATLNISKTVDGSFDFTITQTDLAGNVSSGLLFQWIRDTSVPFTPVIVAPVTQPFHSNQNSLTLQVTCDDTLSPDVAVVELSGNISPADVLSPAGSLTQDCNASPVSFVVQKTSDASYNLSVTQENPTAGTTSAAVSLTWVRDTLAPAAPTITSPTTNPFVAPGNLNLSGSCEPQATVSLTGDSTQSTVCAVGGSYTLSVTKSVDATYNFAVAQTDRAGNISSATNFQWVRDSNSVPAPTLTLPAASPYISNQSNLMVSGTCNDGYVVTLSGDVTAGQVSSPLNSLTQVCSGGVFSYVITKSADGTYQLNLKQTFNAVDSTVTQLQWVRDTVAPAVTIGVNPNDPNLSTSGSFEFSSNEAGATFECKLDSESFSACASPLNYPALVNGARSFQVRATDLAGNVSAVQTYAWTQAAYNAVALYHFDNVDPTADSGFYTQNGIMDHNLSITGTPTEVTGKFGQGLRLGSNIYLSAPTSAALENPISTLTIEGHFRMNTSISTTGNYYTLIAKSGASPEIGWEVRLRKSNNTRYALDFVFSKDGTTITTVSTANQSISTSNWYYFAVTWNKGQTKLYFNSSTANRTNGTVGTSTLFVSPEDLTFGKGPNTGSGAALWYNGSLDEVRISQTLRTISRPSSAFTAD